MIPCNLEPLPIPGSDAEYFTWSYEMTQEYLNDVVANKIYQDGPFEFGSSLGYVDMSEEIAFYTWAFNDHHNVWY